MGAIFWIILHIVFNKNGQGYCMEQYWNLRSYAGWPKPRYGFFKHMKSVHNYAKISLLKFEGIMIFESINQFLRQGNQSSLRGHFASFGLLLASILVSLQIKLTQKCGRTFTYIFSWIFWSTFNIRSGFEICPLRSKNLCDIRHYLK